MVYEKKGIRPPGRTRMMGSITELETGMKNISLKARIVSIQRRERRSGDPFFSGYIADSEGEIPYTAWVDFDLEVNTPVLLQNVSVREWNDRKEVVINSSSFVSTIEEMEGLVPSMEDGVPSTLSELTKDSRNIDIEVRVIRSRETTVNSRGKEKEIVKGVVADRTGRMEFTCWGPVEVRSGDCYRIMGGYVKEFRGVLNLNLSPGSIFTRLSDDRLPPVEDLDRPEESRILNLSQGRFSGPVQLRGTILSIRNGSGLYQKCMECGRRMDRGACTVHGKVASEWDLGFKGIFDDGSGTVFLKGRRHIVEDLLGRSIDEITSEVKESLDPESILEEIEAKVLGRPILVVGDPLLDDYGVVLNASEISMGWDIQQLESEIISMLEVMI
jgi:replication factor A1